MHLICKKMTPVTSLLPVSSPPKPTLHHMVNTLQKCYIYEVKILLTTFDSYVLDMDEFTRELIEDMLRLLKCPECMQYTVPPIKMCASGHTFCNTCREWLQRCPTCTAEFSESRDMTAEKYSRRLYRCSNRKNGCLDLFTIAQMSEHYTFCVYEKIGCPFQVQNMCYWNGLKRYLKEHAKAAHPEELH